MLIDDTQCFAEKATRSPQVDTPLPRPVDGDTIPTKRCCGVLGGDECDCAAFAAGARGVFARPIMCRPASQWGA